MGQASAAYEQGDLTALLQLQIAGRAGGRGSPLPKWLTTSRHFVAATRDQVKRWKKNWETQRCA